MASIPSRSTTFKQRVLEFWNWFESIAPECEASLASDDPKFIVDKVTRYMSKHLPTLSWALGSNASGTLSFTLTGEGIVPKQVLTDFWLSQAIDRPGWEFHASRQPTPRDALRELSIGVSDQDQVDAEHFLLETEVDEESERIDIVAWHPALEKVDDEHHFQILFLLLDEALGEFGVQSWLGEIKVEPLNGESIQRSLLDLPKFIEQVQAYHQWTKLPPLESYSAYEIDEQLEGVPRGDVMVGATCIPQVLFEFMENSGTLPENPLVGTGAELIYVSIEHAQLTEDQSEFRMRIEDALQEALMTASSGRVVGGATGTDRIYIDLILFDGKASRQVIEQTLQSLQLEQPIDLVDF